MKLRMKAYARAHAGMLSDTQKQDLVALLESLDPSTTKIYLGCDSQRVTLKKKNCVRYATVLIVHMDGNKGGRIFEHVETVPDYERNKKSPRLRLMTEACKVCELYLAVFDIIDDYMIEIHLDINTNKIHASNGVAQQAAGYVLGVTGIQPKLKPEASAASTGADKFAKGGLH